jgi:solute carrier family 35 protein E3
VQKAYGINGPSAQHATAFHQFLMALAAALAVETHGSGNIFAHEFAKTEIVVIVLTGFVSVSVNVCAFGLIGRTSAVTYQVAGHCKTILIFIFGLIMFPPKQDETPAQFMKKIAGLVVSMSGMILYTYFELKAKSEKAKDEQRLLPQARAPAEDGVEDLMPNKWLYGNGWSREALEPFNYTPELPLVWR